MDPDVPHDAQRIVAAYLAIVEAHAAAQVYPCSLGDLPYSKKHLRRAFATSTLGLVRTRQLTPELRTYLEIAYVSLADYVDEECATLLREYARTGEELASDRRGPRERTQTDAWHRLAEQSRLAGEVARTISDEAERLRAEFRSWQES